MSNLVSTEPMDEIAIPIEKSYGPFSYDVEGPGWYATCRPEIRRTPKGWQARVAVMRAERAFGDPIYDWVYALDRVGQLRWGEASDYYDNYSFRWRWLARRAAKRYSKRIHRDRTINETSQWGWA